MRLKRGLFRWFIPTLYFNLKCFPIKQAVKLPVYIYRTRFLNLKGKISFADNVQLKRGMVCIGFPETCLYMDKRYTLDIGGQVVFHGECHLGMGGVLSVGPKGLFNVGDCVKMSDSTSIVCHHYIEIGNNSTAGWGCLFCDSDFHSMKNAFTEKKIKAYAPIRIGENNWFGESCTVLKGTVTPVYTTVSACSLLSHKYKCAEKSVLSGNPAQVVSEGCYYRDMNDDKVIYEQYR